MARSGFDRRKSSRRMRRSSSVAMSMLDQDALKAFKIADKKNEMTWTRTFVERYLSKQKWYFPHCDNPDGPNLSEAYTFFEHVTLPRYFSGKEEADHVQRRAEPGEMAQETRLFSPWFTKSSSFIEWGIGLDCYFATLKMLSFIMLIAGLINLPSMMFYASSEYSVNGQSSVPFTLIGSALCTTHEWVVCRDCIADDFRLDEEEMTRLAFTSDGTTLVKRNDCHGAEIKQGLVNYGTAFFLVAAFVGMSLLLNAREVRSDEDKITATDYSIVVRNPPPQSYDPDEWQSFFERVSGDHVTAVTIALDNGELLRKLVARRVQFNNLRLLLKSGTDMDDDIAVLRAIDQLTEEEEAEQSAFTKNILNPMLVAIGLVVPAKKYYQTGMRLTEEIKELQKKHYNVANIFVTFETEEGQRAALKAMAVGKLNLWRNNTQAVNPKTVFQDRILFVEEPAEPDSIRWLDLGTSIRHRVSMWIFSLLVTVASLIIAGICVARTRMNYGVYAAGILVSVFNSAIPQIVQVLMDFEPHLDEDSHETSLYLKITLFRWVNTAVLLKLIVPVTGNVAGGANDILPSINAILLAELLTTPVMKLMDISSNLNKHFYAPRAHNQEQMNMYFQGTPYKIGERYTSMTTIVFVCFFYSALFPAAFFFGAAILTVQHYADKFALMRLWGWRPTAGPQLAKFSRRYFLSGALLAFVVVSAYAWAQFPFDNICDPVAARSGFAGEYSHVQLLNGTMLETVTVTQDTDVQYCSQSWRDSDHFPFPPTSRLEGEDLKYMTESQRVLTNLYGWTAFVAAIAYLAFVFGSDMVAFALSFVRGIYQPNGATQFIDFSSNTEIFAYIPQIRLPNFPFPNLACDIDEIYQGLIGWNDSSQSYDHHNMMFDVKFAGMKRKTRIKGNTRKTGQIKSLTKYTESMDEASTESSRLLPRTGPVFSVIKHYPPPWLKEILDSETEEKPVS